MNHSLESLSLYPLVLNHNLRDLSTNSVPTLLAISNSIEDVVMRYNMTLTFYAGFQRFSAFLPQIERFSRLAAVCGNVIVFGVADAPVPDLPDIEFVALEPDAPLADEWFIVVDHADFGVALMTRQLTKPAAERHSADQEFGRGRLYEGLVTFDEDMVHTARAALHDAMGRSVVLSRRSPDARLSLDSPYNVFGRALVGHLEQRNQQLQGVYETLLEQHRELKRLQQQVRKFMSHRAWAEAQAAESAAENPRGTAEIQLLTILVVDVEGFTRLSESVDPVVLLDGLNRYLDILATTVYQFGGDVDKFLGDGMLAFFESPVAALRATASLLHRVEAFNAQQVAARKPTFPTRAGLATGISLIGRVWSSDRQEITVLGDTVNLASRLQGKAQPGHVVFDTATYEALERPDRALQSMAQIQGKRGIQTIYTLTPDQLGPAVSDVLAQRALSLGQDDPRL